MLVITSGLHHQVRAWIATDINRLSENCGHKTYIATYIQCINYYVDYVDHADKIHVVEAPNTECMCLPPMVICQALLASNSWSVIAPSGNVGSPSQSPAMDALLSDIGQSRYKPPIMPAFLLPWNRYCGSDAAQIQFTSQS
jgi:hypothetical protein